MLRLRARGLGLGRGRWCDHGSRGRSGRRCRCHFYGLGCRSFGDGCWSRRGRWCAGSLVRRRRKEDGMDLGLGRRGCSWRCRRRGGRGLARCALGTEAAGARCGRLPGRGPGFGFGFSLRGGLGLCGWCFNSWGGGWCLDGGCGCCRCGSRGGCFYDGRGFRRGRGPGVGSRMAGGFAGVRRLYRGCGRWCRGGDSGRGSGRGLVGGKRQPGDGMDLRLGHVLRECKTRRS